MGKKALFLVCGGNQLLFALQIKQTIYMAIQADLVYMDISISEKDARPFFDKVYKCCSNEAPPSSEALRCFFFPGRAIKMFYADIDPDMYSDILFYGPTWLFYFLFKYYCHSRKKVQWHLMPEGAGAYLVGGPEFSTKKYGRILTSRIIRAVDMVLWKYPKHVSSIIKDAYLINSKYAGIDCKLHKIDVPLFDPADSSFIKLINRVLMYSPRIISDKVIIIDGSLGRNRSDFYDVDKMDEVIIKFGRTLGKERVILKRKHHVGLNQYCNEIKECVTIFPDENMPWELLCINGVLRSCVIISVLSSAISLPYIMAGYEQETYIIGNSIVEYHLSSQIINESSNLYKKVSRNSGKYRFLRDNADLDGLICELSGYFGLDGSKERNGEQ